jgi:hypothetical protein
MSMNRLLPVACHECMAAYPTGRAAGAQCAGSTCAAADGATARLGVDVRVIQMTLIIFHH